MYTVKNHPLHKPLESQGHGKRFHMIACKLKYTIGIISKLMDAYYYNIDSFYFILV